MTIKVRSLFKYVVTSSERLIQSVNDEKILDDEVTNKV